MQTVWIGFHKQVVEYTKKPVTVITHPDIFDGLVNPPERIILFGDFLKLPHWKSLRDKITALPDKTVEVI